MAIHRDPQFFLNMGFSPNMKRSRKSPGVTSRVRHVARYRSFIARCSRRLSGPGLKHKRNLLVLNSHTSGIFLKTINSVVVKG